MDLIPLLLLWAIGVATGFFIHRQLVYGKPTRELPQNESSGINVTHVEVINGGRDAAYTVKEKNGKESVLVVKIRPIEDNDEN